mgnify:CR=1 FL=1
MRNFKGLIIIFLPIALILILVIIKSLDRNSFSLDTKQALDLSLKQNHIISLKELKEKLQTSEKIIIVDLRKKDNLNNEQLKNSINIPLFEILNNKEMIKLKSNGNEIVLYSNSVSETAKAFTILTQMAYTNLYILDLPDNLILKDVLKKDTLFQSNEILKYKFQPDLDAGLE